MRTKTQFKDLPALIAKHRKAMADMRLSRSMRKLSARIVTRGENILAIHADPNSHKPKAPSAEPLARPLLAWCPKNLAAYQAGILVPGPGPATLERAEWVHRLKVRVQALINAEHHPKATIDGCLGSSIDLLTFRPTETSSWADLLFYGVEGIETMLSETDQEWPATMRANDPETEASLLETTLEEWLGSISR